MMKQKLTLVFCCFLLAALLLTACKKEEVNTLPDPDALTYQEYITMDGELQQAFMESFESVEAFVEWYNAVQKAYFDSLEEIPVETNGAE